MTFKNFILKPKTAQKKEAPESGRSMVEMLGVLAIIGVLSIGGIAGYTMAMNRYRANEIIDIASKVSVIAMSKQYSVDFSTYATMDEVTESDNVAGVTSMTGYDDGTVDMFTEFVDAGTFNAIKTIAGNKFIRGTLESSQLVLNFERY